MNYAGFWKRLAAVLIDLMVFLPLIGLYFWITSKSQTMAIAIQIPYFTLGIFYQIYFQAKWGQTIGKMATSIKVVTLDGQPISWSHAILRNSMYILIGIPQAVGGLMALKALPESQYYSLSWLLRAHELQKLSPPFVRWIGMVSQIWFWSDFCVFVLNDKKRALHDFIAGTVVIRTDPSASSMNLTADVESISKKKKVRNFFLIATLLIISYLFVRLSSYKPVQAHLVKWEQTSPQSLKATIEVSNKRRREMSAQLLLTVSGTVRNVVSGEAIDMREALSQQLIDVTLAPLSSQLVEKEVLNLKQIQNIIVDVHVISTSRKR